MTQSQPVLAYGPAARGGGRWMYVLLAGTATTVLTLALSWAVEHFTKGGFTLMGLYGWGIVPVGAFLVGMGAASGYALAALWAGLRIRRSLLAGILGITVLAYFGQHYVEFAAMGPMVLRSTGRPLSFWTYYDLKTRSLRFVSTGAGRPTPTQADDDKLGGLGYGVRVLELTAFSLGALATPFQLKTRRYCDLCERYHTNYRLAVVPAAVKSRKPLGKAKPDVEAAHAAAAQQADAIVGQLADAVIADDPAAVAAVLDPLAAGSKAAARRLRRVEVRLSRCRQCGHGVFVPTLVTVVNSKNVRRREMWSAPVAPAFADGLRPRER